MIAHLVGQITEKFGNSVIIDVHGVGYEILLSSLDAENTHIDDQLKFYTYHAIRDNSEELYGFSSLVAKRMFEMLISVNSIGPKAAMAILSLGDAETVRNAIANADATFIAKAAGVGKKSAERVIVDLKDRVGEPSVYGRSSSGLTTPTHAEKDDALDALMALGFPLKEATAALAEVDPSLTTEERIKLALKR